MGIQWAGEQTLTELTLLLLAFALSAVIGLERHRKLKSAGMRTHALVGLGSAVFTLVSAYGFPSVQATDTIVDPSRIAAQIVSGIGFLGAGVIFVRRNAVSGLTTAASIWATAAVGMACGAGMPLLAIMATALQLFAVTALGWLGRKWQATPEHTEFVMTYRGGQGSLRTALQLATQAGSTPLVIATKTIERGSRAPRFSAQVRVNLSSHSTAQLLDMVSDVQGIKSVRVIAEEDEHQLG
ncbi:MAG: MgtC/SapB family protein [Propionibacteriales bacterium]|nr:MgtC/SapB family protein [Propionibacteriales bacterium]